MSDTETLNIIQYGLWGDDKIVHTIEVPKDQTPGIPEWAKVALHGFDEWLRFWGIDSCRQPADAKMIELEHFYPAVEFEALENLYTQALALKAERHYVKPLLSDFEFMLWRLEKFFLQHHDQDSFYRRFDRIAVTARFKWMSKITGVSEIMIMRTLNDISLIVGEAIETEADWQLDLLSREMSARAKEIADNMTPRQFREFVKEVMLEHPERAIRKAA